MGESYPAEEDREEIYPAPAWPAEQGRALKTGTLQPNHAGKMLQHRHGVLRKLLLRVQ